MKGAFLLGCIIDMGKYVGFNVLNPTRLKSFLLQACGMVKFALRGENNCRCQSFQATINIEVIIRK
jgi:hypothetical protein